MNRLREKTTATLLIAIFMISAMVLVIPAMAKKKVGVRIQDGILIYSAGHYLAGQPLMLGYDPYGYNYQGHMFNGYYCNVYLGRGGFPPYGGDYNAYQAAYPNVVVQLEANPSTYWYWPHRDVSLLMKWNDAWLSNKDCDSDGLLDRHYGYASYIDSGAWETNHQWGTNPDGTQWNYFVKIVSVSSTDYYDDTNGDGIANNGEIWHLPDGTVLGTSIWRQFAIIFQVSNDPSVPEHGVLYNPPSPTGFGYYK